MTRDDMPSIYHGVSLETPDDAARRLILETVKQHPNWSPDQVSLNLSRDTGRDVSLGMVLSALATQ